MSTLPDFRDDKFVGLRRLFEETKFKIGLEKCIWLTIHECFVLLPMGFLGVSHPVQKLSRSENY
jgi:hypothetical protein